MSANFFLNQLIGRQRCTELLSVQAVLACGLHTKFGSTQGSPSNAVAGIVQTPKGTTKAFYQWEFILLWNANIFHKDHAGSGCPKTEFAFNLGSIQSWRALFNDISSDFTFFVLGPNDKYIGNGRVGNPILATIQDKFVGGAVESGSCLHGRRIGTMIGLGQSKTSIFTRRMH